MALALNCGIPSTPQGRELVQHGSALFPIACYEERLIFIKYTLNRVFCQ